MAGEVDSTEVTVLTELWWGIEPGSYVWTRGWDGDDVAAARDRLAERGLLDGEGGLTGEGRDLRERIERTTDRGARVVLDRLGDGDGELFGLLEPISRALVGPDGYPSSPATMLR
jgi:hypothetical protein